MQIAVLAARSHDAFEILEWESNYQSLQIKAYARAASGLVRCENYLDEGGPARGRGES